MAKEPTPPWIGPSPPPARRAVLRWPRRLCPGEQHENQTLYGLLLTRERARLDEKTRLIERSQMHPLVDRVLDLSEAGRAHERLDSGPRRGKIVLRVAEV
jgi:NADPH:quinone reductase-like Zn-dependent oxidoreductase